MWCLIHRHHEDDWGLFIEGTIYYIGACSTGQLEAGQGQPCTYARQTHETNFKLMASYVHQLRCERRICILMWLIGYYIATILMPTYWLVLATSPVRGKYTQLNLNYRFYRLNPRKPELIFKYKYILFKQIWTRAMIYLLRFLEKEPAL